MDDLWARLKQRKLVQWGAAYLAGAWLLLQVLGLLAQPFAWPDLVLRAASVLLGIGFFAALVLAWYHGERGEQRTNGVELLMLAGILVVAGVAVSTVAPDRATPADAAAPVSAPTVAPGTATRAIAVLPFANRSSDPENGYFASGIHDELLTQLSKLSDLKVISRASVLQYADSRKPLRQIAAELGVGVVLEGTVQRSGPKVRVTAQLIDAGTDEHLWAERYDRDLTDLFAIQSDIAEQIAGALETRLSARERASLERKPTENAEAYDFYLRAREYHVRPGRARKDWEAAERLYERAIALDPRFALAYARLSHVHGRTRWFAYDLSDARVEMQRAAAERALELEPELAEAHLAKGYYYYYGLRDYDRALQEFGIALRGAPNSAEIQLAIAYVHRRQGKFQEALVGQKQGRALDPRNSDAELDLGQTYRVLRHFSEAVRAFDRALELGPDNYDAASWKGRTYVSWRGTVDTLASATQRFPGGVVAGGTSSDEDRFWVARLRRDRAAALRAAENAPEVISTQRRYVPRSLLLGWARQSQGDAPAARAAFEEARTKTEAALRVNPSDYRLHVALGYAQAGLGRRTEAVASARRTEAILPRSRDALVWPELAQDRAAILAQAGDTDGALAELQRLLEGPGNLTPNELKLDPIWDPLRRDPRFQRLLQRKE